ncbi:FecR family protein [Mariprofundus aestuarium]|uniref:FecR family protein n=1 Tax=Mariprofundus aestuarium TaxID=1921086 RepID=A0A2K8L1I7_MARES|nr:FecR domain-containing protein [Mariprofundus aestuarium]ATX80079.1 FecR family protein [Mariprofundus aestuarium]
MVKNGIMGLMMAIISFSCTAIAQDTHVAIIKNVSGSVDVLRKDEKLSAIPGMQLVRSDKIISGQESQAGIVFIDGTLITVGSSTEIEVRKYLFEPKKAKYDFALYVKKGEAIYSSGKLGKLAPDAVNLETPRATVGIRGTRFIVKVD